MKIVVSDKAEDDLVSIFAYLDRQSSKSADLLVKQIDDGIENLLLFPLSGSARPKLGRHIRMILVPPYQVFYAINGDLIEILRVLHGSQNIDVEFRR